MRNKNTEHKTKKVTSAAERRFRAAVFKIRGVGRIGIDKLVQVDIAHLINKIESYGFNFFPNHYIFDDIVALEDIATRVAADAS